NWSIASVVGAVGLRLVAMVPLPRIRARSACPPRRPFHPSAAQIVPRPNQPPLVVHPATSRNCWYPSDTRLTAWSMATSAAPAEGVAMGIPVRGGILHRRTDLLPGLEALACERQRAQDLPPRLDQVQVSGVLGREDELPARMGQREEQDIRG